ncbi:MAG: TOBE domain-containing protein, partial [Granulosicoccus sp.]
DYDFTDKQFAGDVWLGIRPEHIVTGDATAKAGFRTTVEVDIVEPTGADTLVLASLAGKAFRVRMDGQARVSPGEHLEIGINTGFASVFDKASENRL